MLDRPKTRSSDEQGTVLIIVLIMMVVFSLILAATLSNASANFKNTSSLRANDNKIYAADAGINWAIQKIRLDNSQCPTAGTAPGGTTYSLPSAPQFDGLSPTVTCTVTSGSATGGNGYAIITTSLTTSPSYSFATPGPTFTKTVNGPVFASNIDPSIQINVKNGPVSEQQGRCTHVGTSTDQPSGLTISAPFSYTCTATTAASIAAGVDHALPPHSTNGIDSSSAQPAAGNGDSACRVFKPGRYTSLSLAKDNYFVSGVYYFNFSAVGIIDVRKLQVVGGAASSDEQSTAMLTACTDDKTAMGYSSAAAAAANLGTGVKFILGGNASVAVTNPSGRLELFSRQPPSTVTNEGTSGISLQAVDAVAAAVAGGSWVSGASTLTATSNILSEGTGNTPRLRIHGLAYIPNANTSFDATNASNAWLLGGLVTAKLSLRQQASIDAVKVSIQAGIGARTMTLRSTYRDPTNSERQIVAIAEIKIQNDQTRSLTMQSWRVACRKPGSSTDDDCPNI